MQVCRAEDGQVFQVNTNLYEIAKKPATLRPLLASLTSVDPNSMIMFLSDGQQLREDNLRELSGAQDQTIFVFNRDYLDLDIEEVMGTLGIREGDGLIPSDSLQEDSISSLHTSQILQDQSQRAQRHQSYISALFQQIHSQHEALAIASSNLDMHIFTLNEAWIALKESIGSGLDTQAKLLEGIDYDLDAISQLAVHPSFLAVAATKPGAPPTTPSKEKEADTGGPKSKMLGEYVSRAKMKVVVDSCRKIHLELMAKFRSAQNTMDDLAKGSNDVRASINTDSAVSEASLSTKRAMDEVERLGVILNAWSDLDGEGTQEQTDAVLKEIKAIDHRVREEVVLIGEIKNRHTRQLLTTLRQISTLQSAIFALPSTLSALESDIRVKGGFSHLQRLHGMAFAYGASVIEVVRRREFGKFFMQRAQAMAEIMAKFSSSERKRRQVYRGESLSLLPFATQGMDMPAPSLEISTMGVEEVPYDISREDVDALLETMRQIEREHDPLPPGTSTSGSGPHHPIRATREALEKLLARMDSLEADFDKIAEKSILSNARLSYYKRRSINEATAYNEAFEQLRELQDQKQATEQKFSVERANLQNRIRELEVERQQLNSQLPNLETTIEHLQALLQQARNNVEQTHARYEEARARSETYEQDLLQRNSELGKLLDKLAEDEHAQQALQMENLSMAETIKAYGEQLERSNTTNGAHLERIAAMEEDIVSLSEENKVLIQRDEENRRQIDELERQLSEARRAGDEAQSALKDAVRDRDRLLRDHRVEADGDRAVLEHRFAQTRSELDSSRQQVTALQQKLTAVNTQLSSFQSQNSILHKDLSSLREELQRTGRELAASSQSENQAHQKENALRAELTFANNALVQLEGKMERNERILAQVFDVAIAFRNSHAKALAQAQTMLRPIAARASTGPNGLASIADSTFLTPTGQIDVGSPRQGSIVSPQERPASPTPVDPSEPNTALDILREFDLDAFAETIAKTGMTIRKWQKQCKEYRDRARGKISFRNFQRGDLALFLPTRNSVARPWAAFNMSFPHYFLNATGHIAEQLKTREWIVARITSISERVVDSKDPTSNPYGLGNGVKYFMLEVEDWTLNTPSSVIRPKVSKSASTPHKPMGQVESWRDSTILSQSPPQALPSLFSLQSKQDADPDIAEGISPATARPRAATASSIGAGPSSLSRLLAQATKDPSPSENKIVQPSPPSPQKPPVEAKPGVGSLKEETEVRVLDVPKPEPKLEPTPNPKPESVSSVHSSAPAPTVELPVATPSVDKQASTTSSSVEARPAQPPIISPQFRMSPKDSPRPSPRQRPASLHIASGSPLAITSNVNVKGSIPGSTNDPNRRNASVRSSMSSTRPTSLFKRPPFALASSPSKPVVMTPAVTDVMTPSVDSTSPFRVSSESLERSLIQETPSPADSVTEGMNSMLLGHNRFRTTSTITPATSALTQTARSNQPVPSSPLASVISSWTGWRKRRNDSIGTITGSDAHMSASQTARDRRLGASESDAERLLRKYNPRE